MSLTPRIDKVEEKAYGNLIYNGSLRIAQRYGTPSAVSRGVSATPTDNSFHFDRWNTYCAGSTNKDYIISGQLDCPTYSQCGIHNTYCFQYQQRTTPTSTQCAGVDDTIEPFVYAMEGWDYAKIHGKPVTIMFWVKCSRIGTYSFYCGTTATRTYVAPFTISAANTWEKKIINLTLDTSTASYNFDSNIGLWIGFFGYGGANFQTSSINQWVAGKYCQYSGATALQATDTFKIQCIQLVQGTISTSADVEYSDHGRSIKEELDVCQRYYEKSYAIGTAPGTATNAGCYCWAMPATTSNIGGTIPYAVTKRTAATPSYYDNAGTISRIYKGGDGKLAVVAMVTEKSFFIRSNDATNATSAEVQWVCDAEIY